MKGTAVNIDMKPQPHQQTFSSANEPEFLARRINRYYMDRVMNTWSGGHIMRGKIPAHGDIVLRSNDYLSLSNHPDILSAQSKELHNPEKSTLASAIFLYDGSEQQMFEKRLANFMQAPHGILCQSGWCANTGLIQSIADSQTPVYIDMLAHMSLWEGIRSAGAQAIMFYHNDMAHLEKQILKHGPGIVIVDSVYSTNGSVCPLLEVVEISSSLDCVIVVDESHSLGTHGEHGEGMVAMLGIADKVHFRTASLAKAFAGRAGFITCSSRFGEYFICESNPAIFSSTLLPYEVSGLNATLSIIQSEPWRRKQLQSNSSYLRTELETMGYNLNESESQIISLEAGTEQQTIILRDALESRGVFGSVFCAPATPKNRSVIRFSVNAKLSHCELEKIVQVCSEIRDEVDMLNWPSTRRKRSSRRASSTAEIIQNETLTA